MPRSKLPPHLVQYQGLRRCSVCMMLFPDNSQPSVSKGFAEHVVKAHRPNQTPEEETRQAEVEDRQRN